MPAVPAGADEGVAHPLKLPLFAFGVRGSGFGCPLRGGRRKTPRRIHRKSHPAEFRQGGRRERPRPTKKGTRNVRCPSRMSSPKVRQ